MTGSGNKRPYVRCPWCGKQPVSVKRGRLNSHLTPGAQKCIGVGQPIAVVESLRKIKEKSE